jgi:hypothetical protein
LLYACHVLGGSRIRLKHALVLPGDETITSTGGQQQILRKILCDANVYYPNQTSEVELNYTDKPRFHHLTRISDYRFIIPAYKGSG